jgi:hypothetical protein
VVPLRGASRATGITQAEILFRFTTASLAVWLDKVPENVVGRLKADPSFAAEIRAHPKRYSPEAKTMADLVLSARAAGREIEPIPHPGSDVFDLVNEDVVRSQYPKFPGHEAAKAAAEAARAASGTKWKAFYREEYDIEVDAESLARIAVAMRQRNVVPHPALAALIEICERLAMTHG